nr:MAG TPA: hypothetical protein [Caudoviricetes sp.]
MRILLLRWNWVTHRVHIVRYPPFVYTNAYVNVNICPDILFALAN